MTLAERGFRAMYVGAGLCAVGLLQQLLPDQSYTLFEMGGGMFVTGAVMSITAAFQGEKAPGQPPEPNPMLERSREADFRSTQNFGPKD